MQSVKGKKTNIPEEQMAAFLKAIEKLIANNTAMKLLEFLGDAMQWFHNTEFENKNDDHHYTCLLMIRYIIQPWAAGGPNVIQNVATGFAEIETITGEEEGYNRYREAVGSILVGFAEQGNLGIADTDVSGIKSFVDLSNAFELFNVAKQKKHSQAA